MHLRTFIILIFLVSSISIKAQFHITPQIGYTFSSIIQKDTEHSNFIYARDYDKINPAFGVLASKNIGNKLSLQTDLLYSKRGANVVGSAIICGGVYEINSEHLDIGVQLSYNLTKGLTIESGLFHSQLLNMIEFGYGIGGEYKYDLLERYDNETGASLGLSYTLYNITARAKYSFGLWGTRENEKHHWFLLTLGYRFEV